MARDDVSSASFVRKLHFCAFSLLKHLASTNRLTPLLAIFSIISISSAGILQPGDIVFVDGGLDVVIRLDPITHATNHIAAIDFPDATGGIAVGYNGDIYAMRAKLGFDVYAEFFRIDGQTAAVTPLSTQKMIYSGRRMKLSPDGLSLVVAGESQSGGRGVFRVDIATGHQSIITTNLTDSPEYERPWDVAFSPQGHIYVTDYNYNNVLRFNADGSGRQLISDGGLFKFIAGVDVGPDGSIYIADRNNHGIIRVDPVTGLQTQTTTNNLLRNPSDIVVDLDGSLLVAEASADVIVRVNPATGEQTLLHSGTPGPRSPCVFSPRASLTTQRAPSGGLIIRWPDQGDIWQLQSTQTPAVPSSWEDSALVSTLNGDQRKVTAPVDLSASFFRLRRR
jgi:streptogramin lyase